MVKFNIAENGTYTAGEAIAIANLRVKLSSSGTISKAGVADVAIGTVKTIAASGEDVAVRYPTKYGTLLYVASEAIEVGDAVVPAAAGKVANGGEAGVAAGMIGIAVSAATADGNIIEVVKASSDPQGTPVYHYQAADPAVGAAETVHDNVSGANATITGGTITDPDYARNLIVVIGGTAGDVEEGTVTITGLDVAGNALTEDFTTTVDTTETLTGDKAFASVSEIEIDTVGTANVTVGVGTGNKLGLHHKLPRNTVIDGQTFLGDTIEGTDPTVAVSSTVLASNTALLNSTLDDSQVDIYYIVST